MHFLKHIYVEATRESATITLKLIRVTKSVISSTRNQQSERSLKKEKQQSVLQTKTKLIMIMAINPTMAQKWL